MRLLVKKRNFELHSFSKLGRAAACPLKTLGLHVFQFQTNYSIGSLPKLWVVNWRRGVKINLKMKADEVLRNINVSVMLNVQAEIKMGWVYNWDVETRNTGICEQLRSVLSELPKPASVNINTEYSELSGIVVRTGRTDDWDKNNLTHIYITERRT